VGNAPDREELPPAREVITLRAQGMPWRDVAKRLPNRVLAMCKEDYVTFLRKVCVHEQWIYLRKRSQ
jgi:hypothetical protein